MIRDATGALAVLAEKGALGLGALADAVAGEPIRGSWWAHRKGKLIFAIASELEDHDDVLACKLVGKAFYVHRALWPPLVRVVTDDGWTKSVSRGLPPSAVRVVLLTRSGERVRVDKKTLAPRERAALERSCILHVSTEHTETGAHATFARSWASWAPAAVKRAAKRLSFDEARSTLAASGLALPPRV